MVIYDNTRTPLNNLLTTNSVTLTSDNIASIKQCFIAFDTETTGLNSHKDRIVELGAVLFENDHPIKTFSSLVNSGVPISYKASAVNHITNAMLDDAPSEEDIYPKFIDFLGDALNGNIILCAHNASFDMGFLGYTLSRLGYSGTINYIDTLYLSRTYFYELSNHRLATVAHHLRLQNKNAHRASSDALVCGQILWNIVSQL